MKKHYPFYLIIISIYLLLNGCGKKCEDMNYDILNWMPYKKGEAIVFQKNVTFDTCFLDINEIIHTNKIGAWEKCECEDSYFVKIISDSLIIDVKFYQSIDVSNSYVTINNESFSFLKHVDSYNFNDKSYSNVLIYENTKDSDNNRFNNVIISKYIGIIGIIGTLEEWIIFDDSNKKIDITDVEQNIIDC